MKQNERLLVYAVTGFLALILVVALVFSPEPGKNPLKSSTGAQGLDDIIGNRPVAAQTPAATEPKKEAEPAKEAGGPAGAGEKAPASLVGLPSPKDGTAGPVAGQPLNASSASKPLLASELVLQALGPSRTERGVRFVRVLKNDSLEGLVKRWCGARDPFLAEAQALNEDLNMLRAGQEVALPLVSDDALLVAIEAQKPKTLTPAPGSQPTAAGAIDALLANAGADKKAVDAGAPVAANRGTPNAVNQGSPEFAQPGLRNPAGKSSLDGAPSPVAAAGKSYTVKDKDTLWGIAAKTYGRKNADKMIPRIKDANPGLGESLRPGQTLVLPVASGVASEVTTEVGKSGA